MKRILGIVLAAAFVPLAALCAEETGVTGEVPAGLPQVSSNCMFGPPTETVCQRRVRQVAKRSRQYTFAGTLGIDAPTIGYSPYQDANLPSPVIMVSIPTETLTACDRVCEIAVSVARVLVMGDPPTYIIGTAGNGVAVGSANLRSSWYATQNNIASGYSTANGSKFGSRLISLPGHCNCDCIFGFGLWDLAAQLEFEYPGAFAPLPGDIITLSIQVERTYVASKACNMPESCGQPVWAPPTNTVP